MKRIALIATLVALSTGAPLPCDTFEYGLMVPANRLGYGKFTAYELKIIQEVITLVVFVGFAWLVLGEKLKWNYAVSFLFMALAVWFAFGFNKPATPAG